MRTRWRPSHCPWRCGGTDNRRSAGRPRLGCAAALGYGVLKLVWSLGGTVGLRDPEVLRASVMAATGGATILRLLENARTCGIRGRNAGHSLRVRSGSHSDAAAGSPGHHRCNRSPRPQAPGLGDLARHARRAHRCADGRDRNALSAPAGRTGFGYHEPGAGSTGQGWLVLLGITNPGWTRVCGREFRAPLTFTFPGRQIHAARILPDPVAVTARRAARAPAIGGRQYRAGPAGDKAR